MKYITLSFLLICSVLIFILFSNEQVGTQRYDGGIITYQFSDPNECVVKVSGHIDEDLKDKFNEVLSIFEKKNCQKISLYLNSYGGQLLYGVEIGMTVRTKNIETYVTENCDSACGYIFIGGVKRNIQKNRTLGFHQISMKDHRCITLKSIKDPVDREILELGIGHVQLMLGKKVSRKYIEYENMTNCNNMLQVSSSELLSDGIVDNEFE